MRIAVDAMGGDFAPTEVVKGAVLAARKHGVGIVLVGPRDRLQYELAGQGTDGVSIEIVHTDEYLVEGEAPAYALRTKRNASIAVATKLVRDGKADAVVSAGATGGMVAAALSILGTIDGIARPVLGGPFLGFALNTVVMDLGGNIDCRSDQLLDFAVVGTVYARTVLNIENPTVALLSNGAEGGKGNQQVKEAHELLGKSGVNFIGNVEGSDILAGKAEVIICDGFVGNILVKFYEAMGRIVRDWLVDQLADKLLPDELGALTDELMLATNRADRMGGGPLWAVNGVVVVTHGGSRAVEIATAVGHAKSFVEKNIVALLKEGLAAARQAD